MKAADDKRKDGPLADEELERVAGGDGGSEITMWGGYRVAPNRCWCPYCNDETDGDGYAPPTVRDGVLGTLYLCTNGHIFAVLM